MLFNSFEYQAAELPVQIHTNQHQRLQFLFGVAVVGIIYVLCKLRRAIPPTEYAIAYCQQPQNRPLVNRKTIYMRITTIVHQKTIVHHLQNFGTYFSGGFSMTLSRYAVTTTVSIFTAFCLSSFASIRSRYTSRVIYTVSWIMRSRITTLSRRSK